MSTGSLAIFQRTPERVVPRDDNLFINSECLSVEF